MKRLIVSWQNYEWVKYCSGMILKEPQHEYVVMVVCKDDRRPILEHDQLCKDAIYAQRRYDLFSICKVLKVKQAYNLGCEPDVINLHKLIAHIQINLVVGRISEIYYSDHILLNRVFAKFPDRIKIYTYGDLDMAKIIKDDCTFWLNKEYRLTIKEYDLKKQLADLMIGVNNKKEKLYFSYTEKFYRGE